MNIGLDAALSLVAIIFVVASIVTLRAIVRAKEGCESPQGFINVAGSKS